ncbi:MAG: glutamate dehydrogenase [Bacteroidales bacterium]|nr:glutamate dehydrogenase [Bacteroidales bacterium]
MTTNAFQQQVDEFMAKIIAKNPAESEFHQAVLEVAESLIPFIEENPKYKVNKILERIAEPERVIMFRVPWLDDKGNTQINRGFRIEMNSAIGPYKGGMRFHPTVNLGILKFLAFEQVLKNSLTTLPMGGGKGGSDFDPKGKSDNEVMKFCYSFMNELFRHIGPNTDVPAGDIGVGGREIGFMFGQYKKLRNEFTGVFTGKGIDWGGSLIRPEATELGAKIVTLSDSQGYIHDPKGIDAEKLAFVMNLKNVTRGRIKEYCDKYTEAQFFEGKRPWEVKCDIALPSATENEVNGEEAKMLISNGCICVSEGANMPSTPEAIEVYIDKKILYGPGKAANAGGVATSGLEMPQNSLRMSWTREEVDSRLHNIMVNIHKTCVKFGTESDGFINYVKGANIGGFVKVADAMLAQGLV